MSRTPLWTCFVLGVALLTARAGSQPPPAQTFDPIEQGLEPMPLVASNFGLRIHLPAGSVVTSNVYNGELSYLITEGGAAPTWTMRVQALTPSKAAQTAEMLVQQYLRSVRTRNPNIRVIVNEPVDVVGATGHRIYLERPATDAGRGAGVSGWIVLASSEYDFLVFSLATTATDFQRLRPVLDASIATISIQRQDEVQAIRMARLERGRMMISSFTPEKLRSLLGRIGRKTVYRIYTPSASGRRMDDTEIGYLTMECREGMRGELNAQRPRESYSEMEAQVGLVLVIEAKVLFPDETDHFVDIHSLYWMAWDRAKEAWSTRRTERVGKKVIGTTAETGIRDFGILNVVVSSKERMSREPKQWGLPDRAYLCQPEVFFLGSLLPQDGSAGEDMAFYYYDSHRQRMPLRVDRFNPTGDGSGSWTLTSELATDAGTIRQIFDPQGNRLKRIDVSGVITERIDRQELQRLWKRKGLSSQ